ncbi:serine/threonine-protein kinase [Phytomonospora sp. NPDC050363]|uniref:serine/threonine-protein kinase n=1 Tax=Phytomonospora sp. NPDC050363 TaxID=3155642 RepID=UPI0033EFC89B
MSTSPGLLLDGRYRLDSHIATGGMGEVWRAEDTTLRRVVAVKILSPGLAGDAAFRERFAVEARTVAALRAPGVVSVYDAVETVFEDGRPLVFLVMQHLTGESLAELLHEHGRLTPERTMSIIAQVADALDAAHREGVVHRDVKPANIIVDHDDRATIVDFGVARAQGEAALTAAGNILATIQYAAPEQLSGEKPGPRADIYSLGVVAYECLTGQAPFAADATAATVAGHLLRPPPPLPPEIPGAIAAVVDRALAKDPGDRYASAAQFAAACRPATRPFPVTRRETPVASPPSRRRLLVGATAAAAAIVVVSLLMWGLGGAPSGPNAAADTAADTDAPRLPADARLSSASTGTCLHGSQELGRPHLADCDSAATITFSVAGDAYLLGLPGGGDERCLAPSGSPEKIEIKGCDASAGWKVEWLGDDGGRDRWRLASPAHPGQCLSATGTFVEDEDDGDDGGDGDGAGNGDHGKGKEKDKDDKGKGNGKGHGKGREPVVYQAVRLAACDASDDQAWLTA